MVMVIIGGTSIGCRVVLLAVLAMVVFLKEAVREAVVIRGKWGATVARTDWTVTTGGFGPTEMHRAITQVIKKPK